MSSLLLLASDSEVAGAGEGTVEGKPEGNAVDALARCIFVAAALDPSVLLGPLQLLVGGAGAGLRAVDGRPRQPGLGNPRPRGFRADDPVPDAARVAVPALPAALLAAVATYGTLPVADILRPAVELARARSAARAAVLERIAQRGPAALADARVADELVAAAGRMAGGLLSVRDLDELRPVIAPVPSRLLAGASGRHIVTVPWGAAAVRDPAAPSSGAGDTRILIAADTKGLVAIACYAVAGPDKGLRIDAHDLVAPFAASPVMRGEPRVKPGEPRSAAAPIALGLAEGIVELAAGVEAIDDAERALGAWLTTYEPSSSSFAASRETARLTGLVAAQRGASAWVRARRES